MEELNENVEATEVDEVVETEVIETLQDEVVEEKTYTQADIDNLQAQIDELAQYRPKEVSEADIRLEQVWQREVAQTLKEEGLEIFSEFIRADVDDNNALQSQITKLKEIVGALELSNSYQPTNHKSPDAYSLAKKNKDVKSMISQKLSN
ncbi:xanthine phosphoribosyltransferase [Priestia megaterium]